MKKQNIVRITEKYNSNLSSKIRNEKINYIVNKKIEVLCEIKNNNLINIVEEEKNYFTNKDELKNKTVVYAKGYCQNDWQEYILFHNLNKDNSDLKELINILEKSFTHQNNYIAEKFERIEINGKIFDAEPHDTINFCITDIEFPNEDDVKERYNDDIGDDDYDEIIVELNR